MAETAEHSASTAPRRLLRRRRPAVAPSAAPAPVAQAIRSPGRGQPLPPAVRRPLAHSLGVDVEPVRVHTDPAAAAAARALTARAFAYGTDVYLAEGERATDLPLIAHEVAHVVQQQAQPAPQPYTPAGDGLEREAEHVASAVTRGEPARVEGGAGGPRVQGLFGFGDWVEGKIWDALEEFAPVLVPIIRKGFFTWLTEKISAAVEALFDTLMKPVRAVTGIVESLTGHFANLVQWIKDAAAQIARGDCSSITEAAEKIQDVFMGLATPVIEKVQGWIATVKEFFVDMWDRFGAPIWDFLKQVGGAIWETIKDIASWIWDKTKPIRDWLGRAWKWIKDKLGIGEGPEGQNGILQWVQEKAGQAWTWVKAKAEPYKKQILIVAGVILAITGGPIFALAAVIGGLIYGIRWIAQHLRTRGSVLDQRSVLEREVIPRIMGAVGAVGAKLRGIAGFLTEKFGAIVAGLGKVAGQLAGSILAFLVSVVDWLVSKFTLLLAWATEKVEAIAEWVKSALERLKAFLAPVLEFVRWIGSVIADIWNLVSGVVKRIWNRIPACIKDPVVSFLINQVLKRIPIFNKLLEVKNIWDKVKGAALEVIRAIFVKWDIKAAVLRFFDLILVILEIPLDLVKSIYAKARAAFEEIVKDPLGFLRNTLKAVFEGFGLFFDNIATHLWNGVMGWFRAQMKKAGIEIPTEWTFKSIVALVLSIAGISVEKVFQILEKKLNNKPLVAKIRKLYRFLTGVWEWVSIALDQGAAGLWEKIKQTAGNLWDALIGALVGWVTKQVVKLASPRLLAALNPIGAIINGILAAWAAIQTAAEYARQILDIVNTVLDTALDLARGVTGRAAGFVEKALAMAVPMAVGFLANFIRLGNLGERVKEMLKPLQDKVEAAIGTIIDKALETGRAILERLGIGKAAGEDLPFDAGGQQHHVWVVGEEETTAKVMVASDEPKEYEAQLKDFDGRYEEELPGKGERSAAKSAISRGTTKLRAWRAARGPARSPILAEMRDIMKELYSLLGHPDAPPAVVDFGPGKTAWAKPLTRRAGAVKGDEDTSNFPPAHAVAQKALNNVLNVWRRLHMLSARLHGPNDERNFILGTQQANSEMFSKIEDPTITKLAAGKKSTQLWYETKVTRHPKPSEYAAKTIVVTQGKWDIPKGAPGTEETSVRITSDEPSLAVGAIDIHAHGREVIRDLGLGGADVPGADSAARSIRKLIDLNGGRRFTTWGSFDAAVKATPPGVLDASQETILDLVFEARNATPKRLKLG